MLLPHEQPANFRSRTMAYLRLFRPRQAIKNVVCLGGVLFGPSRIEQLDAWALALFTAGVFTVASAAMYIVNDLCDRGFDQQHARKRFRPIASGQVSPTAATALAITLAAIALGVATSVNLALVLVLLAYLANTLIYSLWTKHIPLWDVMAIAMGFLLRLLAGIYVLGDTPTAWIMLCMFFLCTLIAVCKRRSEYLLYQDVGSEFNVASSDSSTRPVLAGYNLAFLDGMLNATAVMTMVCYALFTAVSHKNPTLVVTVPLVFVGIMHFKRLVLFHGKGEEPERIFLHDRALQAIVAVWLALYLVIVHSQVELFR